MRALLLMASLTLVAACAACGRSPEPAAPAAKAAPTEAPRPPKPKVLVEATNQAAALTVQVLDAQRITADTVRIEIALINTSRAPEPLDVVAALTGSPSASFTPEDLCLLTPDGSRRLFVLRDAADKPLTRRRLRAAAAGRAPERLGRLPEPRARRPPRSTWCWPAWCSPTCRLRRRPTKPRTPPPPRLQARRLPRRRQPLGLTTPPPEPPGRERGRVSRTCWNCPEADNVSCRVSPSVPDEAVASGPYGPDDSRTAVPENRTAGR